MICRNITYMLTLGLLLLSFVGGSIAEPYTPFEGYDLVQPGDPGNIAKYDDGSRRIKQDASAQEGNREGDNEAENMGVVDGSFAIRAKSLDEYKQRVKYLVEQEWRQLTDTQEPPEGTIMAMLFDEDGTLRYVTLVEQVGLIDHEKVFLEAAWKAGPYPMLLDNDQIKPVFIGW